MEIQSKLSLNQPNDAYEKEADAVADKVVRKAPPENLSQPFFRPGISSLQRKCTHCEEEEKKMQRKEEKGNPSIDDGELESYVNQLNSRGRPLSNELRDFYEPRFGYDFGNVKVHTDGTAAQSAKAIHALAYTSGNHIVFGNGQYSTDTQSGKRLLGHELTHVVQQNSAAPENTIQRKDEACANKKRVMVDLISFPGSSRNPYDDMTEANRIFSPCCVEFIPGEGKSVDPHFSDPLMGNDTTFERATCGTDSSEEQTLIPAVSRAFGLHGRLRAFYFESINPSARAMSHPQYCSTPLALNHVYMTNTAAARTLAHEFGHILLNGYYHELPSDNLMHPTNTATGSNLTPEQCATIFGNV